MEHNGFALNWARKTKAGFEIAVEYGSVIYYAKRFNFICKQRKFYLTKITVDSFNKHNPETWKTKIVRVKPNVPLEKFLIDDFTAEGVVRFFGSKNTHSTFEQLCCKKISRAKVQSAAAFPGILFAPLRLCARNLLGIKTLFCANS